MQKGHHMRCCYSLGLFSLDALSTNSFKSAMYSWARASLAPKLRVWVWITVHDWSSWCSKFLNSPVMKFLAAFTFYSSATSSSTLTSSYLLSLCWDEDDDLRGKGTAPPLDSR